MIRTWSENSLYMALLNSIYYVLKKNIRLIIDLKINQTFLLCLTLNVSIHRSVLSSDWCSSWPCLRWYSDDTERTAETQSCCITAHHCICRLDASVHVAGMWRVCESCSTSCLCFYGCVWARVGLLFCCCPRQKPDVKIDVKI